MIHIRTHLRLDGLKIGADGGELLGVLCDSRARLLVPAGMGTCLG